MDKNLDRQIVEPLLKAADVAKRLNISRTSAYRLMGSEIPCVKFGIGIVRVKQSDLERFIDSRVQVGNHE